MPPLHPLLLAALAEPRTPAVRPRPLPLARRRRLTRRQAAPPWGGGRTVNPCLAGRC
jgi:hypothetical protein